MNSHEPYAPKKQKAPRKPKKTSVTVTKATSKKPVATTSKRVVAKRSFRKK